MPSATLFILFAPVHPPLIDSMIAMLLPLLNHGYV